jgi:hypothetical protein
MIIKRLQAQIAQEALNYVTPSKPCIESPSNRGYCIDELKCYFYNTGKNANCSKIGSEAYCAITAWTMTHKAFVRLGIDTAILSKMKTARAVDLMNFAKKHGVVVDKNYKIGDIFYRKSGDPSASGHVGIIVGFDNKYIYTVEGNNSFKLNDKKVSGVWEWKYPLQDINKRGFQFVHIGEYVSSSQVDYTFKSKISNVSVNYGGGDGFGLEYPSLIAGTVAIAGLSYYLFKNVWK